MNSNPTLLNAYIQKNIPAEVHENQLYRALLQEAILDVMEFLHIDEEGFVKNCQVWPHYSKEIFENHLSKNQDESFYLAWEGDVGISNLCANLLDQFKRKDVCRILDRLSQSQPERMLDYGCGTGSLTFSFFKKTKVYFLDVPNLAQQFLDWRIKKHQLQHETITPEKGLFPLESFDIIACVDVLEHLKNPSEILIQKIHPYLKKNGYLILRAPWGGHPEHLPEAEVDWAAHGGEKLLNQYRLVEEIPKNRGVSGLYQK